MAVASGGTEILLHGINTLVSVSAGAGLRWLYERWKRIRFTASGWTLLYGSQDSFGAVNLSPGVPDTRLHHVQYHFTVRIFNEKSSAIGLHRFSVLFTRGKGRSKKIVGQDDQLRHGKLQTARHQSYREKLGEMMLEPHAWAVEDITGYPEGMETAVQTADAVWFVAHAASGERYEWHVADLVPVA
jgi:hypothetical protein